jgi:hypothetical protein
MNPNSDSRKMELGTKFPPSFLVKPSKNFTRKALTNTAIPTLESIPRLKSVNFFRKDNKKPIRLTNFGHLTLGKALDTDRTTSNRESFKKSLLIPKVILNEKNPLRVFFILKKKKKGL